MRKLLFVSIALFAVASSFAQKKLSIKDITPELSVYPCQDRYEALVVIRCSEDFELEFKSNVDRELSITREVEGTEKIYNIVFKTREEGTSFKGRMLSIMAPFFDKIYVPLELKQKEKKEFLVSDPYSSLRSPFYSYLEKGNELFTEGMYGQAKDQYHMAQRCPEYLDFDNTIDQYLTLCDSMISWTEIVDEAEAKGDYYRARDYLAMMTNNNTKCVTLRERYNNVMIDYNIRCNADMANGEQYMLDGYYEKAKAVYQNAVAMRNPRIAEAEYKLHEIEKLTYKKTNKTRTFFYQSLENCPIGFMSAGCMPSGSAGYFSMNLNKSCFDLLTNINERFDEFTMDYQVNVSAGWTVPMYKSYAFLYFTPFAYTGGGCSIIMPKGEASGDNMFTTFVNQDIRWYHAVSPEVGIILKYWRVALNYKYKYKYWIGDCDGLKDVLGSSVHSFGVGIAW
ncbi:MAG: hypothetical protein IKY64_08805 [Bacteroidaceae bacterium]|nr:hypothetical protein [Bacteroidaceae bacterium]